ncbi:hypothetical protein LOZ51_004551 [Ophidiomyces ophidiicola]|nr:hypothetical protein LOZ51_004551 [Ophidiomyces ophidiicola]
MEPCKHQVARQLRCTFAGCNYICSSERELMKHKKYSPQHEYCHKCDQDFEDEESFMIHKIQSTKHIACPICGDDFKSEGGRGLHLVQMHRAEQKITCVGCHATFSRAYALMAHVESGSCEGFTEEQYRAQRIQKRATRAALESQIGGRRALPGACGTTASVAESLDGGVRLNILDDSELPIPERRMRDIVARASIGDEELDDATSEISGITHSTKQWPTMVLDDKNGKEKCDNDDLMAFSDLGIDDTEDSNMAANEEETGELDDWGEAPPMESGEKRLKEHFTLWDTDQLYNTVLGAYVCPCDKVFKTPEEISDHLNSGIHDGGVV